MVQTTGSDSAVADAKRQASKLPLKIFINNEFHDAKEGKTLPVIDPCTGETYLHCAASTAADVDAACQAAHKAFTSGAWPNTTGAARARLLNKFADLLDEHAVELANLECLDVGMPLMVAQHFMIPAGAGQFRYAAGWADKITGETVEADASGFGYTLREPLGVCGAIIPWNGPLLMWIVKVASAVACGNTIVVKLSVEAGFPPGVINVVPGYGPEAGEPLARQPLVHKVSLAAAAAAAHNEGYVVFVIRRGEQVAFTGSKPAGQAVMQAAAETLKECTLELGGKSPLIICEDADLDQAAAAALHMFLNSGQVCTAPSRLFVHEAIYDQFLDKVLQLTKKRSVGSPFEHSTEQGPQCDLKGFNKVLQYIESGKTQGARLVTGGKRLGTAGYFVEPTIFADATDDMDIAKDEIFGPVLTALKWSTLDEVLARANATDYGLAAGVFTKNLATANTLSKGLQAGTVWVNCWTKFDPRLPFGGYKGSGTGREFGKEMITHYTQLKTVMIAT